MNWRETLTKIISPEIYQKSLDYTQLKIDHDDLVKTHESLDAKYKKLQEDNYKLRMQISALTPVEVTKPSFLVREPIFIPKRRFVSKVYDFQVSFSDPCEIFDKSVRLTKLMKNYGLVNIPKTYENLCRVREFIHTVYNEYTLDKLENWRAITETILAKKGDCEDVAQVIVSALGIAGWRADEVFLATGQYCANGQKIGHAWAVAKCEGEWYVIEGTNTTKDEINNIPITWASVKAKYKCVWGLWNWKFKGMIKNGKLYLEDE